MADLIRLVRAAEARYPSRPAVRAGGQTLLYAHTADRSNRAATLLRSLHGTEDGIVALLVGNRLEAVELDIALIKAALGRISLNPRLSYDEMRYIIADSGTRVLVYAPEYAAIVEQLAREFPGLQLVGLGTSGSGPGRRYEDELQAASPLTTVPDVNGGAPSLLMYTSGTTGRPKGATWTFASRGAGTINMLVNELTPHAARNMAHVGSLSHGSGSKVVPVYLRGGCNTVLTRFDPDEFLASANELGITATFVVPTMVKMLLDAAESLPGNPLSTMHHICYGGAKMPLGTIEAALERFGDRFFQVYGSCEAPHPMLFLSLEDHATRDPRILSSAGRPAIGVDLRIGDLETTPTPGAQGEILLRSPSLMSGYWNSPEATAEAFEDGYYRTGDVGVIHDDGLVEIVDRIKNMIISGGYNVYPAEVERVLAAHPKVAQASVYGLDHPHWGEIVAAAIIPRESGVTEDELSRYCGEHLAGYKKPRAFRFVEQFPLGSTAKILSADLRRAHGAALLEETR